MPINGLTTARLYQLQKNYMQFVKCCLSVILSLIADLNVLISGGNSAFYEVPKNAIMSDSQPPEVIDMACISDRKFRLKLYGNKNQASGELIYNGFSLTPDAELYCTVIEDGPGKVNLSLMNKPDAAKTYTCLEPGSLIEYSADFIWIGNFFSFCCIKCFCITTIVWTCMFKEAQQF